MKKCNSNQLMDFIELSLLLKGKNWKWLADQCGCCPSLFSCYKKEKVPVPRYRITSIAQALEVDPAGMLIMAGFVPDGERMTMLSYSSQAKEKRTFELFCSDDEQYLGIINSLRKEARKMRGKENETLRR